MGPDDRIRVAVAYALPDVQTVLQLEIAAGTTALEAVRASGLIERHPEIESRSIELAIFGRKVPLETPLKAGDRVEVLRPLIHDPKETRRALAGRGQTMGRKVPR